MWWKIGLVLVIPAVLSACAGARSASKGTHYRHYATGHYAIPKSDVPLVVNDKVVAWVDYFTGPGRERFGRYIKRSGRYMPMMRRILKSYGLPQDMIYLAMIESGFASKARSYASAVGVWQFIRSTGNRYGLDQDVWIDERQDAEKATHAAAQYLRDLYGEFGDWYLAMAAYNAGEGTVRRGIARSGSRNFWELSDPRKGVFRAETRDYVPKYIAAAIIAKNPDQFGFGHVRPENPIAYEVIAVDTHVDIDIIARCAGVNVDAIDVLNSELKLGTAPPKYQVKLPPGTSRRFQLALARIAPEDRVKVLTLTEHHTVARGETLHAIAKRFGVKPSMILASNGLRSARSVKRGMTLSIPVGDLKSTLLTRAGVVRKGGSSAVAGMVKVRRGDTLKSLSERYDVSIADLRDWNDLNGRHSALKVGSVVRVQAPDAVTDSATGMATSALVAKSAPTMPVEPHSKQAPRTAAAVPVADGGTVANGYVVSVGDSWNSISQTLGLSTRILKQMNPDVASKGLQIGDVLRITATPKQVAEATIPKNADSEPGTDASSPEPVVASDVPTRAVERIEVESSVESPVGRVTPLRGSTAKSARTAYYKVRPGDSLEKIANRHGVTVANLRAWNQLGKGYIRPGQKLTVSAPVQANRPGARVGSKSARLEARDEVTTTSARTPLKPTTPKAAGAVGGKVVRAHSKVVSYKVKPGDSLWKIGKKHNISPQQIKQLSQMNKPLRPGDVITFRAGS